MNRTWLCLLPALHFACATTNTTQPAAQTQANAEAAAATAANMHTAVKLGPEHQGLANCVGTWDVEQTMWMGPEESKAKGQQECRAILGGLGVEYDFESEMMGEKFLGHGFAVWNPTKKMYESYWIDNFSHSGAAQGLGTFDPETKTLTETMIGTEPDGKKSEFRVVTFFESDDKHTMTFYKKIGDQEHKAMELQYLRRK